MEMVIENLPSYRIAYVRQVGPYGPANVQAMNTLKQWADKNQLLHESAILFGIPRMTQLPHRPKNVDMMPVLLLPNLNVWKMILLRLASY